MDPTEKALMYHWAQAIVAAKMGVEDAIADTLRETMGENFTNHVLELVDSVEQEQ